MVDLRRLGRLASRIQVRGIRALGAHAIARWRRSGALRIAALAITIKCTLFVYGWLAYVIIPQETRVRLVDSGLGVDWLAIWARWDVRAYIAIAQEGYVVDDIHRLAFFPFFSLLMRAGSYMVGNAFLAGLIISNLAGIAAVVLLYRLAVSRLGDEGVGERAATYALLFPAAFFGVTAYTESWFLLLAIACFSAIERQQWLWAGTAAALAAASRPPGVLLAIPIALAYGQWVLRERRISFGALGVPLPLVGVALVMLIFQSDVGEPLAFMRAQQEAFHRNWVSPLTTLWQGWEVLRWQHLVRGFEQQWTINALNWSATVLWIALSISSFRTLGIPYGVWALAAVVAPASFSLVGLSADRPLDAMLRYVYVVFPGFLVLATWGRHPLVDRLIVTAFTLFLGLLTGLFVRSWDVPGVS